MQRWVRKSLWSYPSWKGQIALMVFNALLLLFDTTSRRMDGWGTGFDGIFFVEDNVDESGVYIENQALNQSTPVPKP
jgi:hypothetical protein